MGVVATERAPGSGPKGAGRSDGPPRAPLRRRGPARAHRRPTNLRRATAWLIDTLAGAALYALALGLGWRPGLASGFEASLWVGVDTFAERLAEAPASAYRLWLTAWLPWCVLVTAELLVGGRTLGWWAMGLRPVDAEGLAPSPLRLCGLGVGYLLWPASLGLLWPMAWVSRSQRGVPERLAGVWVVRPGSGGRRVECINRANRS